MKTVKATLPIPTKFTKEFLIDIREKIGSDSYNRQFCMDAAVKSSLTIYTNFDVYKNVVNKDLDERYPIILSPDWNISEKISYMGWVIIQDINGVIYVVDEIPMVSMSVIDACKVYKSRFQPNIPIEVYGDPAGWTKQQAGGLNNFRVMMEQLEPWCTGGVSFKIRPTYTNAGKEVLPAHPGRISRHNAVNNKLLTPSGQRELFVDPRCETTLKTVNLCQYKPGRESDNESDLGHVWCGIGYFIAQKYPFVRYYEIAENTFSRGPTHDIELRLSKLHSANNPINYLGTEA